MNDREPSKEQIAQWKSWKRFHRAGNCSVCNAYSKELVQLSRMNMSEHKIFCLPCAVEANSAYWKGK